MNFTQLQNTINQFGLTPVLQVKLFKSFIVIALFFIFKSIVLKIINKKLKQQDAIYRWQKITSYSFSLFSFIIVGSIWYSGVQSIATFFGLIGAGLAVAFKDYLSNIAGWLYIFWKEPFKVGHRIQIGAHVGDIVDIGPVQLSLLEIGSFANSEQPTGRINFLPNAKVFTEVISNYDLSFPYIWHEIEVVVTFESDWKRAKSIIEDRIKNNSLVYDEHSLGRFRRQSKNFLLPDMILDPKMFTSVADHGVRLSARFVCEPRNRRTIEEKVWEGILERFSNEDSIDFAYPTQRFYNNMTEGKESFNAKEKNSKR